MKTLNPLTAQHYLHVFPDGALQVIGMLCETRQCWKKAAEGIPWISVMAESEMEGIRWEDPSLVVILWRDSPVPVERSCRVGRVYLETLYGVGTLPTTPYQRNLLEEFEAKCSRLDFTVVQTPSMVNDAKARGWPTPLLCPTGWDPDVMGRPDFSIQKTLDIGCYGTNYGHREEAMPPLLVAMSGSLFQFTGLGNARKRTLDHFAAVLTVLHSPGCSYPTMRLWQAAASSAAMISEPGDAWPARPGEHYVQIPLIRSGDALGETVRLLREILADRLTLMLTAKRAYESLREFTPEWCMGFLAPQIMEAERA